MRTSYLFSVKIVSIKWRILQGILARLNLVASLFTDLTLKEQMFASSAIYRRAILQEKMEIENFLDVYIIMCIN